MTHQLTFRRTLLLALALAGLLFIAMISIASADERNCPHDKCNKPLPTLTPDAISFLDASVSGAPIAPDGDVAGGETGVVITLNTSLHPNVPGRSLMHGRTIRVILPAAMQFDNSAQYPIQSVGTETCRAGNMLCSSGMLLQGWPQHPVSPDKYAFSYDAAAHAVVFTALADIVPTGSEPGVKQILLILRGFHNPTAGEYPIGIEAETGDGGAMESTTAMLEIVPETRPRISLTSVYNEGAPNTIYQKALAFANTRFPYDLLLWDKNGQPMEGVSFEPVSGNSGLLKQGDLTVGQVTVDVAARAQGWMLAAAGPSTVVNAPILDMPAARLTAQFQAGSPGTYTITFALDGGNSVQAYVNAGIGVVETGEIPECPHKNWMICR